MKVDIVEINPNYERQYIYKEYLSETKLLDFSNKNIQKLILDNKWNELSDVEKVKSSYNFTKEKILFGYNKDDCLKATEVLKDGFGQCNTKSILLMALLRALKTPCRIHGFTDKKLQKGSMTGLVYKLAPKEIFHTYVEVYFNNRWYDLEGVILDDKYLNSLQKNYKTKYRWIICWLWSCNKEFFKSNNIF